MSLILILSLVVVLPVAIWAVVAATPAAIARKIHSVR